MSGDRGYASVPERITWTTGFRLPIDKIVLGTLSTFASFETGKGARVRVNTLAARAGLEPRTVQRALHRLEVDGWIVAAWRQNKRATKWDIQIDRLATSWVVGGVMPSFPQVTKSRTSPVSFDSNVTAVVRSNVTNDVREPISNDTAVVRECNLRFSNDTGVVQIPCTEQDLIPRQEQIPSAPALRAGWFEDDDEKTPEGHAPQSTTPTADLRADGAHHPVHAAGGLDRHRSGDRSAPAPGLPLRQGADSSSPESVDRPRAPAGPQQQTFGPIDVSPSPSRPALQWGQLAEALREGLKRKSG